MSVKKRCMFCHKHTRPDGTCQTKGCPLYVPEEKGTDDTTNTTEEKDATDTNVGGKEK